MPGKKILICVSEFPPVTGGVGKHAHDLALHLAEAGQEVHVLAEGEAKSASGKYPFKLTITTRTALYPLTFVKRFLATLWLALSFRPNVIIASNRSAVFMSALFSILFHHIKYIAVVHGNELLDTSAFRQKIVRWALNRFQHVVAVSRYTQGLLIQSGFRGQSSIIHNGLSDVWLHGQSPKTFSPGQPLVLATVGTIRPRKGHLHVLRALPALQKIFPQVTYCICGSKQYHPAYVDEIVLEAQNLKVENCLRFVWVDTEKALREFYRACTIHVLLSETQPNGDTEGFGISLLEAAACGTPVIGARGCGIEDAVADGENGILVDPGNPGQFVDAVKKIIAGYHVYSEKALRHAQHFRWEDLVKAYEKLL